jgi:hypothetical protein
MTLKLLPHESGFQQIVGAVVVEIGLSVNESAPAPNNSPAPKVPSPFPKDALKLPFAGC